ncbi:unnamed protein product [Brassica rapa]|uniref:Transposase n=2 Tax=Brassica TaxID=3705 RepID=A0A8D9DJM1_BRACM|nr:unnamed protein product [Brassica napus]CAG7878590.1 unnamed protein product [Brassica rapa]
MLHMILFAAVCWNILSLSCPVKVVKDNQVRRNYRRVVTATKVYFRETITS